MQKTAATKEGTSSYLKIYKKIYRKGHQPSRFYMMSARMGNSLNIFKIVLQLHSQSNEQTMQNLARTRDENDTEQDMTNESRKWANKG